MEIVIILTLVILLSATQVQGCKPLDILDTIIHKLITTISQVMRWLLTTLLSQTPDKNSGTSNSYIKRVNRLSQNRGSGIIEIDQQPDLITFTVPEGYGIWRVVGSDANGDFTIFVHDNSAITPTTVSLRLETALGNFIHNRIRVDWINQSNKQTGYALITVTDWLAQ